MLEKRTAKAEENGDQQMLGYDGDMCEVMASCRGKRFVVVLGLSRCCGSGLAPILKLPIFLPHVMITLTSAESG